MKKLHIFKVHFGVKIILFFSTKMKPFFFVREKIVLLCIINVHSFILALIAFYQSARGFKIPWIWTVSIDDWPDVSPLNTGTPHLHNDHPIWWGARDYVTFMALLSCGDYHSLWPRYCGGLYEVCGFLIAVDYIKSVALLSW